MRTMSPGLAGWRAGFQVYNYRTALERMRHVETVILRITEDLSRKEGESMAVVTGWINRYIRSYEMLRQPYVLDWEDGSYSDRNYEVESADFEVEVPEGYRLLETQLGETALFAPGSTTDGMTLAEALVKGIAKVDGKIRASDGTEFVAAHLARRV